MLQKHRFNFRNGRIGIQQRDLDESSILQSIHNTCVLQTLYCIPLGVKENFGSISQMYTTAVYDAEGRRP